MNFLEIYKKSFLIAVTNPFVTMFLVLFMIVSNLLAAYMLQTRDLILASILSFCVFMLSLCFISGWFYVIKEIIQNKENENKNYFGTFFEGVGRNIVPIGIGSVLYSIVIIFAIFLSVKVAQNIFGSLDFIKDTTLITQDSKAIMEFYNNLTPEQKSAVAGCELSFLFSIMLVNFLMLFYFPAIIYNEKSNIFLKAFIAIKDSICFLFKNFFGALSIHISLCAIYMMIGILNTILGGNTFISILVLFIYIYFIAGAIMLIFMYYDEKNNCTNGCNCIRENENIDKLGEEN